MVKQFKRRNTSGRQELRVLTYDGSGVWVRAFICFATVQGQRWSRTWLWKSLTRQQALKPTLRSSGESCFRRTSSFPGSPARRGTRPPPKHKMIDPSHWSPCKSMQERLGKHPINLTHLVSGSFSVQQLCGGTSISGLVVSILPSVMTGDNFHLEYQIFSRWYFLWKLLMIQ